MVERERESEGVHERGLKALDSFGGRTRAVAGIAATAERRSGEGETDETETGEGTMREAT